ncbi:EAL domain-containing protein [Pseudothauera hydrothermalis]|jgi:diguanylate cyclase (GGDEF)-like protein|uniref:bifunctional diguanylate cyclase/phosphodiesterase n=1 Tax=Pseudothauera hydrothermalis TaxID=2184083 RepID=UPI000C7C35AC|nr:EAL domain-containing protein [Pseudothauera hydrothermalis]AUM01219.1 hypothetical protein B4966_14425 [Rhodocyclaceae bacterium]
MQAPVTLRQTILSRMLLLAGGSALVITAGFLVLWMMPALEHIAKAEFERVAGRVQARLDQTFTPVEQLLAAGAGWIAADPPQLDDPASFNRRFAPVLRASASITSVVAGDTAGRGWMLLQQDGGRLLNRFTDPARWGARHLFIQHEADGTQTVYWETRDYDPRRRPWYTGAMAASEDQAVHWTAPYTFLTTGDPGITASRPIRLPDGSGFVLGYDVMLRDLSAATLNEQVGRRGFALILTEDERVLGLPAMPAGIDSDDWFGSLLLPVSALGMRPINDALAVWRQGGRQAVPVQRMSSGGQDWLLSQRPYALGAYRLWVLTLAPADDFAPPWVLIGVALSGALALLMLIAGLIAHNQARRIARPLETLAAASQRIGALDFSPLPPVISPIAEIAQLASAQERMRQMLQRSQHSLRNQAARLAAQVEELRAAEARINALAFYDPLTGLPNRRLLADRLERALAGCRRHSQRGALLLLDLDDFKTLNDTLGHEQGDALLEEVARRLQACVRDADTVARLGGDEFVVVLEALDSQAAAACEQAEAVAGKILAALTQPYQLGGQTLTTSASIGVTLFDGSAPRDELFKQADLAMYQAKAEGRNRLCFYGQAMRERLTARTRLEQELRAAIDARQFILHYQPQVDAGGRIIGAEALLRWQHPERGMVPPGAFIPIAEETGLILPIGRQVIELACTQLAHWADQPGCADLTLSINVSARQFRHAGFMDEVRAALRHSGANAARLRLELTESMLLDDIDAVIARMTALRELGVSFSLDDFGTGYSSLAYLKRLPLAELKIDQSFVRDVLVDPNDAAIAHTIITLAHTMGLTVIAEGVENAAQRDLLAELGCDAYQGYLFGRPVPAEQLPLSVQPLGTRPIK